MFDPVSNPSTCVADGTENQLAKVSCSPAEGTIEVRVRVRVRVRARVGVGVRVRVRVRVPLLCAR